MDPNARLTAFKSIHDFVCLLGESYGKKNRGLKCYKLLIEKTTFSHSGPIDKHIEAFKKFCNSNKDAIHKADQSLITDPVIFYSDNVHIDMNVIFKTADIVDVPTIWSHCLAISALVCDNKESRELFRANLEASNKINDNSSSDITSNLIGNLMAGIDDENGAPDIGKAFQTILGGLMGSLKNGDVDIGSLMGSIAEKTDALNKEADGDPEKEKMMGGVSELLSSFTKDGGKDDQPDIGGILAGIMGALGGGDGDKGDKPFDIASLLGGLASSMASPGEAPDVGNETDTTIPSGPPSVISSMVNMMAGGVPPSVPMGATPDFSKSV
jgi:hypothetical protein